MRTEPGGRGQTSWKDWGISPEGAKYTPDPYTCSHCWQVFNEVESFTLGFSSKVLDEKPSKYLLPHRRHQVLGVVVKKCPNCSGLFWSHADQYRVDHLLLFAKLGRRLEPQAQKQLLEAWEEDDED